MGLLQRINDPADLRALPLSHLPKVAEEIRSTIVEVIGQKGGHLASGLGVVELTIALHRVYDFLHDRLVFDVSHQCYPHKLLTGRRDRFHSIRQRHGLAGYTHPEESPYDLFHFAHAGTAISVLLGMAEGDHAQGGAPRHHVAVVGDASIATGIAFEALNHGGVLERDVLVILNDNEMSISKSVGAFSEYLSRVRAGGFYNELKETAHRFLQSIPVVGERLEQDIMRTRDAVLGAIRPGYLFEALGPRYFGPVNGHDIGHLMSILEDLKRQKGFKLLHVITEKGRGHLDAVKDPIKWHGISPKLPPSTPPVREFSRQGVRNWSDVFADAAIARAERDPSLRVITAAMPDNTAVTRFMKAHPDKAFDVGICEQHAVAFAAGLAKSGLKPVCVILSTFLQRAFDQVFHEVALNHIPVVFCIDRAGVVGPDGATHNGSYDIAYMRTFPDIVLMAARDASEFQAMFDLALDSGKAVAIRYPRTAAPDAQRELPLRRELMMGLAEKLRSGSDVAIFALGHLVYPAMEAAEILAAEGIEVTVVNARFVRPMDIDMLRDLLAHHTQVFTLEEHTLRGGFASAVLEECALHGLDAGRIRPIALPDALVPHGSRAELMQELRLDPRGLAQRIRESLHNVQPR